MATDTQELDRIAAEAAAEAVAQQPAGPGPVAPQEDPSELLAKEIGGLVKALVAMAAPALPSLARIYTDQTIGAASSVLAKVCAKHGWLTGGVMGEHAEEITALLVCGPLAVATYQGVRADLAAMRAAESKPNAEPAGPQQPQADAGGHQAMKLPPIP